MTATATFRHKFIAAVLAFAGGGLGLHHAYLGRRRLALAYAAWLLVGIALFAAFGHRARVWLLVLALMPVWAGFAECMALAVMEDARFDTRWNPQAPRRNHNGWNCVLLAIGAMLLGTTAVMTAIILAAQFYYEANGVPIG